MYSQEPRIEDRTTWGDVVGAIIAGATCLGAIALFLTFIHISNGPSELTSTPMDARTSPPIMARNPSRSQSTE
jgi:hypothetical protein